MDEARAVQHYTAQAAACGVQQQLAKYVCLLPLILQLACKPCGCRYVLQEQQVRDAVETALELVNMKQFMHRATHTLSGGQRQRVAIAGA
jgi:ABC-type glutathione transport system ATPase component